MANLRLFTVPANFIVLPSALNARWKVHLCTVPGVGPVAQIAFGLGPVQVIA